MIWEEYSHISNEYMMKTSLKNEKFWDFFLCKKHLTFKNGRPDRTKCKWINFSQITTTNELIFFIGLGTAISHLITQID